MFYATFEDLFLNHSIIIDDEELKRYSKAWKKPAVSRDLAKYDIAEDNEDRNTENVRMMYRPRGAQIEALYALQESRMEGAAKGLVYAATGIGKTYLGTKYVANTLDQGTEEKLVILPQTVDCLTFVEYTLAQAMGSSFADNLQKIRYRDGVIDGYTSRLHYTSDWIENGVRQGFLEDVTAQNSTQTTKLSLSYMSTHPQKYRQLADSPENVKRMAEHEKALSGKKVHWLPKGKLPDAGLPWIMDGDIIAITTNLPGLDVAHVGMAEYINGKLHLLHASSTLGKVVVSEEPLSQMLRNNKSWSGIRVVRMSHP